MKVISFKASTWSMYDPISITAKLENGETIELEINGHDPGTPKTFLEREGYEVDCGYDDWKWQWNET